MIKQKNSSSTSSVPKLRIWNSRMWIFIYCLCSLPKAKRPSKIDFSVWIPEELRLSKRKSWKERGRVKKRKKSSTARKNSSRFCETSGKLKRWETPLVKCKCMMFPPTRCTDHVSCIHSFSTRMRAEYSLYVIWFSFPSPSKWMAFLTHQLTCLTVPFCKHHLTPAVFSLP